jgi:hypothetical protein
MSMLLNPFIFGSGEPPPFDFGGVRQLSRPVAARYYRVINLNHSSNGSFIAEVEFRDSPAGSDLTSPSMTVVSNFTFNPVANLFDDNNATGSFGGTNTHFGIDFGAGNPQIVEEISVRNFNTEQVFRAGRVERSDDGSTWTTAWPATKTAINGTSGGINVFRHDEHDDGLIFDLRATQDPPVEQVSGVTFTKAGSPTINTATQYMQFSANNTLTIPIPAVPNFRLEGRSDWTIEFHVDDCTAWQCPIFFPGTSFEVFDSGGRLGLFVSNVSRPIYTAASVLDGGEHHFAIVHQNGVPKVYRDGISIALSDANLARWLPTAGGTARIGGEGAATRIFPGKLGRVLIWNFARYVADFVPPDVTDVPLYEI